MISLAPGERRTIKLRVNGEQRSCEVEARWLLSDVLRRVHGLTGTHVGCEQGVCGACAVLIDGSPVRSCLTLAVTVDGHDVETVEGLVQRSDLTPLLEEFSRHGGLQCGFCTPGMLMACVPLMNGEGVPTEAVVRRQLTGQLCRCTGYVGIVDAVRAAAARTHGAGS
jgi:aerobic carbon-monoxide dehydrogenase small subunit